MAAKGNVIITCATTGSIHTPSMSPHLPITPNEIAEQSIAAVKAGKHIIVEKPMALNIKDSVEMIKAAGDNGVKLGVIYQKRTEDASQKVKKAIDGILKNCKIFVLRKILNLYL